MIEFNLNNLSDLNSGQLAGTCRPLHLLQKLNNEANPDWKKVDQARQQFLMNFDEIPSWNFLPVQLWIEAMGSDHNDLRQDQIRDFYILAVIGTWRLTQYIYKFDENLQKALGEFPLNGLLPAEAFFYLPAWCVYIETPGLEVKLNTQDQAMTNVNGFYAQTEFIGNAGSPRLIVMLDLDSQLYGMTLSLTKDSLEIAAHKTMGVHANYLNSDEDEKSIFEGLSKEMEAIWQKLLPFVLYLCSSNAEVHTEGIARSGHPQPTKTKKGYRHFPPNSPQKWEVGFRIGANFGKRESDSDSESQSATRLGPRPHVRCGHFHGFWSGQRKSPEGLDLKNDHANPKRTFTLKWLPPTYVNTKKTTDIVSTVRPVRDSACADFINNR